MHSLKCEGKPLPKGVRLERPWSCSCGEKFFGFDNAVAHAFSAHKKNS